MAACALPSCGISSGSRAHPARPRERRLVAVYNQQQPRNGNGSLKSEEEAAPVPAIKYQNLQKGYFGDEPYRVVPGIGKFYLDELDVIFLFNPPHFLTPIQKKYSHAAFIWKKIDKVPEQRRIRILELVEDRHIQLTWDTAGMRYLSPKLFSDDAFNSLPAPEIEEPFILKHFRGKLAGDCWPFSWMRDISVAFFVGKDEDIYGHLTCHGVSGAALSLRQRMYFKVRPAMCIPSTDEECDMVLEFGDGQRHLSSVLPPSFPKPVGLKWPFVDTAVYIRPLGPGVLVGQLCDRRPGMPPKFLAKLMLIQDV